MLVLKKNHLRSTAVGQLSRPLVTYTRNSEVTQDVTLFHQHWLYNRENVLHNRKVDSYYFTHTDDGWGVSMILSPHSGNEPLLGLD